MAVEVANRRVAGRVAKEQLQRGEISVGRSSDEGGVASEIACVEIAERDERSYGSVHFAEDGEQKG